MSSQKEQLRPGQMFVTGLIASTLLLFIVYVVAHIFVSDEFSHASLDKTYRISPAGEMILMDVHTITWVIGEEIATPILKRMQAQTNQIRILLERLATQESRVARLWKNEIGSDKPVKGSPLFIINRAKNSGNWRSAGNELVLLVEQYEGLDVDDLINSIRIVTDTLAELARIKNEQENDRLALSPSKTKSIFWTSSYGSMTEVFFLALFGVLTNLLVNSAEYLRKGQFKESERWVAYTKLVYGPVVSVILITAIIMGWFDVGDYDTRAYTMPLLGFIFGYASRRSVALFDKLVGKIMGAADKSIEEGPDKIAKKEARYLKQFEASFKPRNLAALATKAHEMAAKYVKAEALKMEGE